MYTHAFILEAQRSFVLD